MVTVAIDRPPSRRSESSGSPKLALALAAVSLLIGLGAGFWLGRATAPGASAPAAAESAAAPAGAAAGAVAVAPAVPGAPAPAVPGPAAVALPSAVSTTSGVTAASLVLPPAGPRRLSVTVNGALEDSIAGALPPGERARASELSAVVNRLLVWDLQVARDGRKGDRLEVLWAPPSPAAPGLPASGEPVVLALRYASSKLGGVLSAYRFEAKGGKYARYYRADGREVELRLLDAPVADYEQVTSLLKDGRKHKGVDFKAPVGSPVYAPFDGVIERRNWNFARNGNCLDLRDPATGRHAIFLHLDVVPREMSAGRRVKKGEVIAASGNSGRSYAPHLHYQLEDAAGRVLDPFEVLQTERRALPASEKAAFEAARVQLDNALGG